MALTNIKERLQRVCDFFGLSSRKAVVGKGITPTTNAKKNRLCRGLVKQHDTARSEASFSIRRQPSSRLSALWACIKQIKEKKFNTIRPKLTNNTRRSLRTWPVDRPAPLVCDPTAANSSKWRTNENKMEESINTIKFTINSYIAYRTKYKIDGWS